MKPSTFKFNSKEHKKYLEKVRKFAKEQRKHNRKTYDTMKTKKRKSNTST